MSELHLILGGCGFIGRHVAVLLARSGRNVVVADRVPPPYGFPSDAAHRIKWRHLELASADWDSLVADAAVIHHYAWTSIPASANFNPSGDLTSNVTSTIALLEAVRRRGAGCIVFSSSGGTVYGNLQHVPVSEDHPLLPITAYGAGKATAEIYFSLYRLLHHVDCRVARIANPYGAGQNLARGLGAATKFLHSALTGEPIVIWGDGEVVRDYIHISDVAAAMLALASIPKLGQTYTFNIGSGHGVSLNGIVQELEQRFKEKLVVERTPGRPFDVPVSVLDISRAQEVLGWTPRLNFSKGMALTLADLSNRAEFSTLEPAHAGTN